MHENLGIYLAICHETWQFGSSNAPTKTLCGNFENFHFFAGCAAQKVQKWGKNPNLNLPRGATSQKIKIFKLSAYTFLRAIWWTYLPLFMTNGPVDSQIFALFCEIWVFFEPDFLYKRVKKGSNHPSRQRLYLGNRLELRDKWAHFGN